VDQVELLQVQQEMDLLEVPVQVVAKQVEHLDQQPVKPILLVTQLQLVAVKEVAKLEQVE